MRGDRNRPAAGEGGVEDAAGHHRRTLDSLDVPRERGVEGEDIASVDREGVVLEVDEVDLHRVVGEEDVALAGDLHQRHALTREGLLEELPDAAGSLVGEVDLALVGDHRSLPCHHVPVERDPEPARVLQREAVGRGRLEVRAEQFTAHGSLLGLDVLARYATPARMSGGF